MHANIMLHLNIDISHFLFVVLATSVSFFSEVYTIQAAGGA